MNDAANQNPKTDFDDGEFVETLVVVTCHDIKTLVVGECYIAGT